jgi:hypothetical protein
MQGDSNQGACSFEVNEHAWVFLLRKNWRTSCRIKVDLHTLTSLVGAVDLVATVRNFERFDFVSLADKVALKVRLLHPFVLGCIAGRACHRDSRQGKDRNSDKYFFHNEAFLSV